MIRNLSRRAVLAAPAILVSRRAFAAPDRVRIAVFNVASTMPYYVAQRRGLFAAEGLDVVPTFLNAPPLIIQAMITGDVDGSSNLVTLEGANIDARRPGTAIYISLNGQNAQYRMEQFVVGPKSTAKTLTDLKGARILSAPGPANMSAARGVLASVGLQDGRDYTLTEQPMGVHVGAVMAGTFDAGYTLEPQGTIALQQGARLLEAGVIATHLIGRAGSEAYAAGACLTGKFIAEQPDAARRFAAAWGKSLDMIRADPSTREVLTSDLNTPPELAAIVPLQDFTMVRNLGPQQLADFQKFIDIGVQQGVVRDPVKISDIIRAL